MHGDDLPNILNVVSIVLTLIVVMYARGTIMEARPSLRLPARASAAAFG